MKKTPKIIVTGVMALSFTLYAEDYQSEPKEYIYQEGESVILKKCTAPDECKIVFTDNAEEETPDDQHTAFKSCLRNDQTWDECKTILGYKDRATKLPEQEWTTGLGFCSAPALMSGNCRR